MKVTGKIEVFKGDKGFVGKLTAFNGKKQVTGALYLPIYVSNLELNEKETATINLKEAFLNVVTSKNIKGEIFTHFCVNVKDYELLTTFKGK